MAVAIVVLPAVLVWTLREPRPGSYGAAALPTG
jgi:hypothetical protein